MNSYYLWRGVDAIEDLDDCTSDEEAIAILKTKINNDWTLWRRNGLHATLLGIIKQNGVLVLFN